MKRAARAILFLLAAVLAAAQQQGPRYLNSLPVFSPDGKRIAFVSNRHGAGGELYVVNADGTGERRLTNTPESEGMPSWSPDGRKLLYRTGSGRNPEMHTIDVETGAVETLDSSAGTPLTRNAAGALVLSKGSWPQATLVLRKPDGSDVTISPAEAIGFWPVWSNSGAQLAFVHLKPNQADPRNSAMGIAVVNADGSGFRKVTPDSIRAETPAWFPDGKRIAFQSAVSGNYDLWIVNIDGTGLRRLTTGPQLEETPHVSPDGRTIVFQSERDGVVDLWLMDANGSNIRKLLR